MKIARWAVGGAWLATCCLMGCGANDISNPNDIVFPDTNVSFTQHVQPFLTLSCDSYGCHDQSRSDNKFVALNSFADIRTINVVNQPGDTTCNLVRIVKGIDITHAAPIHPTDNQRRGITRWVREGAKDN
jgi:hypothetical protein